MFVDRLLINNKKNQRFLKLSKIKKKSFLSFLCCMYILCNIILLIQFYIIYIHFLLSDVSSIWDIHLWDKCEPEGFSTEIPNRDLKRGDNVMMQHDQQLATA